MGTGSWDLLQVRDYRLVFRSRVIYRIGEISGYFKIWGKYLGHEINFEK